MRRSTFVCCCLLLLLGCASPTPPPPSPAPTAATLPTASPMPLPSPTLLPTSTARPTLPPTPTAIVVPTLAPTIAAAKGWSQITATNAGPSPRYDHSVLVDSVRQILVVFGGRGARTFGDTWIFDLTKREWREVKGNSPAPRFGHAVVYDATNRRMALIMGEGAGFFNDVWAFDLDKETWTQLKASAIAPDAPRPRYGQSAILDGKGRVIVSHGFSDQGRFDDTWAFELATAKWVNLTPPSGPKPLKRCLHELVYDAAMERMILFGGCSSGFGPCPQGDLWSFDLKTNSWTELKPSGDAPTARQNPTLVYANQQIVLFGGRTSAGANAETWSYNLASNRWTKLVGDQAPAARSSHDMDYDAKSNRIIIFGGRGADNLTDIWEWRF